jgi:hypothetical protein
MMRLEDMTYEDFNKLKKLLSSGQVKVNIDIRVYIDSDDIGDDWSDDYIPCYDLPEEPPEPEINCPPHLKMDPREW